MMITILWIASQLLFIGLVYLDTSYLSALKRVAKQNWLRTTFNKHRLAHAEMETGKCLKQFEKINEIVRE
jgi:hypothetical protein